MESQYEDRMLEAFVQKPEKMHFYKKLLNASFVNGVTTFKWQWSWWAFFAGWLFLLYRKAYLPALVAFIASFFVGLIPIFGWLIVMVTLGGVAPHFVIRRYLTLKAEIEAQNEDEQTRIDTMRQLGGYHSWVVWVAAIFWGLMAIMLIAGLGAAAAGGL
jgi:hypothetical protein